MADVAAANGGVSRGVASAGAFSKWRRHDAGTTSGEGVKAADAAQMALSAKRLYRALAKTRVSS